MDTYNDVEFDVEELLVTNGMIQDYFWLQDMKQRKLFINEIIDPTIVSDIVKSILQFNKDDKGIPYEERRPILLYISTNGGDVDAGFELIDVIIASKTPVYTINLGYCYSMGFLIYLAGHKRICSENSKFLMHDGTSAVFNSSSKVKDQLLFNDKVEDRIKHFVLEKTNISEKEYNKKLRTEWYMFADEAKENGITDEIIGQDCDIDKII